MVFDRYAKLNFIGFCFKVKLFDFNCMRNFTAVVQKDPDTALYVAYVTGFSESAFLRRNLRRAISEPT